MEKCKQFLDYAAKEDAVVTYRASDITLAIYTVMLPSYEPKACSREGRHFFISENKTDPMDKDALHTVIQII